MHFGILETKYSLVISEQNWFLTVTKTIKHPLISISQQICVCVCVCVNALCFNFCDVLAFNMYPGLQHQQQKRIAERVRKTNGQKTQTDKPEKTGV